MKKRFLSCLDAKIFTSLSLAAVALFCFIVPAHAQNCNAGQVLASGGNGVIACADGLTVDARGDVMTIGSLTIGSMKDRLVVKGMENQTVDGLASTSLMVRGALDTQATFVPALTFIQDTQTNLNIGGVPMLILAANGANFTSDVYINHPPTSTKPTNLYVNGAVYASSFYVGGPPAANGSVEANAEMAPTPVKMLTSADMPPVCTGKNVLQFDGAKYNCVSLASLLK